MKIGLNARALAVDQPDGAVKVGLELHDRIAQCPEHDLVSFGPAGLDLSSKVVSTGYPTNSQAYGLLWERTVLPVVAAREGLDVLLCPNANGFIHRTSLPVVIYIHDMNSFYGYSSKLYSMYERAMLPLVAAKADHIITVSEFSKRELTKFLGTPPSKISVVYNGIDPEYLSEDDGSAFELPEKYVLFVGSLNPRKNIDGVLRSFKRFSESHPEYKLVLIGPKNKAVFQSYSVPLSDDVVLPGFVSQQQLQYAYTNASALLFPSHYEGFGIPPLEAMACGTPVVASDTSSLPEILQDAAAFAGPTDYEALADQLERIVTDEEYRSALIAKGSRRAQSFTWERSTREVLSVLRDVCSR